MLAVMRTRTFTALRRRLALRCQSTATADPALGTAEASFKAGSQLFENHGKFLGGAATAVGVVAVVVGQVTASTVHIKAEVRRVDELTKVEARRVDEQAKHLSEQAKTEARRLEDLVKHEVAQRKETEKTTAEAMLRQAAQSDAANQTSKADMFRVLVGFEHQEAVEMAKEKNMR